MAANNMMPKIKEAPVTMNPILEELIAEILIDEKKHVSFPRWANWRNMRRKT